MQSKPVCVLGAGLMGVGIATHFARYGHDVWLYDTDSSRIAEISAVASGILDELITAEQFAVDEKDQVVSRLHGTTSLPEIAACGLLIEAIPERLELKHALYAQLEDLIAPEAVIASNTSGLPPDQLAQGMRLPERKSSSILSGCSSPISGTRHILFRWSKLSPAPPPKRNTCVSCNSGCSRCNWKPSCSIAPHQGLSAIDCSLLCFVKRFISLKAASPAQRWWIRSCVPRSDVAMRWLVRWKRQI